MSERPTTCPREHSIEWISAHLCYCDPCRSFFTWHYSAPGGFYSGIHAGDELIAAIRSDRTALAQLTTENDHYRVALQEVNALALEAAAKYDEERKRAAILTEQRDEAVGQSIGLAQESDRLLDVHAELGLPDDGDAVEAIKKLRQARERAEAACAALRDTLALVDAVHRAVNGETNADVDGLTLLQVWGRLQATLAADNPGAAYLAVVEDARKWRAAYTDRWIEPQAFLDAGQKLRDAVDALNAPKGATE